MVTQWLYLLLLLIYYYRFLLVGDQGQENIYNHSHLLCLHCLSFTCFFVVESCLLGNFPPFSSLLICLAISKLIAFSTNLNEFRFLISTLVPNLLCSFCFTEMFASHLMDPLAYFHHISLNAGQALLGLYK